MQKPGMARLRSPAAPMAWRGGMMVWSFRERLAPQETAEGIYSVSFNPPRPGVYYVQLLQNRNVIPLETAGQLIFEVVEK